MKKKNKGLDFEVDKLTNSIENRITHEFFDTEVNRIGIKDINQIKKSDWQFNWKKEIKNHSKEVYKLTTVANPFVIQGLLSIENKDDHFFMHLIESAKFNKGKEKMYLGVLGNLVAYACKVSKDIGYGGFVAFDSKTALIQHYEKVLGATHFGGIRMVIAEREALKLIIQYFKS